MKIFERKPSLAAFLLAAAVFLCGCNAAEPLKPNPEALPMVTTAPAIDTAMTPMPASESVAVPPVNRFSAEQVTLGPFAAEDNKYILEETVEDDICRLVLVHAGGELELFENFSAFSDAYLVTGTVLAAPILFVCADEMSDDYAVVSCVLTADGAMIVDRYAGRVTAVDTETKRIKLAEQFTVLGSWIGERAYDIAPDGRLLPAELGLLTIANGAERSVALAADLAAEVYQGGEWQRTVLEAGVQMFPTETDGESLVYVTLLADGQQCRLHFTQSDGEVLFDGIPEHELFTDLMYAG